MHGTHFSLSLPPSHTQILSVIRTQFTTLKESACKLRKDVQRSLSEFGSQQENLIRSLQGSPFSAIPYCIAYPCIQITTELIQRNSYRLIVVWFVFLSLFTASLVFRSQPASLPLSFSLILYFHHTGIDHGKVGLNDKT